MAVAMETLETNKPEDVPKVEVPEMEVEKEEVEEMKEAKEVEEEKEGDGSRSSGKRRRGTVTPVDRPNRERKTVERYTEWVSSRSATKQVSIEQGPGTQLKDIPNVAFNLSKRKLDQTLKSLHTVLFGKHAKFNVLKQNIGLFSGYVWADDEEKQREKVKEKLDKYVKEKLSDFCDFLNIQNHKSLKKEEVVLKLLEFLESPCVTTKVLLAEKEQKSKKRKAKSRKNKTPSKKQSGEKKKRLLSTEEDESSQSENDSQEDDNKVSDEEEEYQPKKQLKSEKSSKSVKKNTKKEEQSVEKDSTKSPSKDQDNEKINKNKEEPTTEELHAVVVKMLKEVDFDNVTVSDILKQLATHFGMDLTQRKAEAKAIITEAINDMADGEDEDGDNDS